jgi:hypothetical protein
MPWNGVEGSAFGTIAWLTSTPGAAARVAEGPGTRCSAAKIDAEQIARQTHVAHTPVRAFPIIGVLQVVAWIWVKREAPIHRVILSNAGVDAGRTASTRLARGQRECHECGDVSRLPEARISLQSRA